MIDDVGGNKTEALQTMFEDWCAASEDWTKSSLLVQMRQSTSTKKRGGRRWLTEGQIAQKYNSAEIAREIVKSKENCEFMKKSQIRAHEDLPDRQDLRLFLVWDESWEATETDLVVETLFKQRESSGKGSKKEKKDRRRKRSTSSSDSSSDSSSCGSDSSSSSAKKSKRKKRDKSNKGKDKKDKDKKKQKALKEAEKERKQKEREDAKEKKRAENEANKERKSGENKIRASAKKDPRTEKPI